uniref:ubiquitinyl hydrolase 1 n=2 Tax=Lygus hesperus TaxID=30085 RepID=A0A0A9X9Q2_LYGHE
MDCDGIPSDPEIDVTKPDGEVNSTSSLFEPIATFDDVEIPLASDKMGLENTWDDEPMAIPLPPPPSPLDVFEYNQSGYDLGLFPPAVNLEEPLVEGFNGQPGVCGIRNLGNTCFMSAGVQSLMATAPLVVSFVKSPIPVQHTLSRSLAGLAKMIWTSKQHVIRPTEFKESLVTHFPQFNDCRQHDCQEFLALLLGGLHEQMNTAVNKKTNVGNGGRDSPDSASKKLAQMDDQYHPSTSHGNCDQNMESEDISDTSDVPIKDESDAKDSSSAPEMNNVLNSKFLLRKDNSEPLSCDNQLNNIFPSSMSGDGVHVMNNSLQQFSGMEDILKTAKTSNINVLNEQQEANNEIRFDSEKYPRRSIFDNPRRKGEQFNTNSFHLYENNTGGKRQKSSVTYFSCAADFKEGLDWKRLKLHSDEQDGKNKKMELERQNKTAEAVVLEKNQRLACEQLEASEGCSKDPDLPRSPNPKIADLKLLPAVENMGEEHWRTHLAENRSVIVDTFQGQFKSTVVCSSCNFVSVTYEPFMYLSVPLPNALQRQISVTFISCSSNEPMFCALQVNKYDSIGTLKEKLSDHIGYDRSVNITMAEVLDHHVSKILHDSFPIRYLKDSDRLLYAFEVISPVEIERFEESKGEEPAVENSCTICLEEKPDMKHHCNCSCKLCEQCISVYCQRSTGPNFKCPVCWKGISPDVDLVPLQNDCQQSIRMINVPLVFRVDKTGDGNNNQKSVELFGHPRLLRIPSTISSETLHALLKGFLQVRTNIKYSGLMERGITVHGVCTTSIVVAVLFQKKVISISPQVYFGCCLRISDEFGE